MFDGFTLLYFFAYLKGTVENILIPVKYHVTSNTVKLATY